jgi:hypothetical protein
LAYTLGDLTTRVQKKIKDTSFATGNITDYLNDAQNDLLNEYNLRFMETSQTYTLTANNADITSGGSLPTNLVRPKNIVITYNGFEQKLMYMTQEEIDEIFPDPTDTTLYQANTPLYWYRFGNTIKVFPTPDKAYTVTLEYLKSPTELSSAADVPDLPQEFREYLVLGAAGRAMEEKDNYDQAAYLLNRASTIGAKLVARYGRRQSGQPTVMRINRVRHASSN